MNNFAITSGGLGDIIERGGAAMATANTSLERTLALGTAGNEILNNPERVGNGLKTLALRLRGSTIELQEAGEEVDEYVTSTSKMQEKIKAITDVDIMRSATEYKDVYEILDEIALVYKDLKDIDKAALTEALFGKNQANLGTAILTNFETARNVLKDLESGAAAGSATKEYEKWLGSLEAKVGKLGSTFERASIALFDDDMLGDAIDGLSSILSLVAGISEVVGSIPSLAGIAGGIFGGMFSDFAPLSLKKDSFGIQTSFNAFPRMREEMRASLTNDLELMHQYLKLTDTGEELTKKQNSLMARMSDSARVEILAGGFDSKVLSDYHKKQDDIIKQTKLGTKAAGAFKTVMSSVVSIGSSMLLSAGIGLALDLIVKGVNSAVYATEDLLDRSKELKDSWHESKEELNDNKKVLDQYGDRFAVLSQGVSPTGANVSLGTEEYAEYLSIRNQIASTFPELIRGYDAEGNALLNLSGNVQNVTNALKEAYDEQVRQQRIQEQTDFLSTVGKASYTEMYGYGSAWNPWRDFSGGKSSHIQNAQALIDLLSDEENAYKNLQQIVDLYNNKAHAVTSSHVDGWDDMGPTFAELMKGIVYNDAFNELGRVKQSRNFAEDAPKVISKLAAEYIKTLTQSLNMSDWQAEGRRVLEGAFDKGGSLSKLDENTKKALLPIFDYLNDPEWYAQFEGSASAFHAYLTEHLLTPLENSEIQKAIGDMFAAEGDWLSGNATYDDYTNRLNSQLNLLGQMGELGQKLYESMFDNDLDAKINHAAHALGVTADEVKQLLTLPQLDWIDRNVESGVSVTYENVLAGLEEEAVQAANAIDTLTASYTKFTEARTAGMSALSALSEKGYLMPEEVQQIADAGLSGAVKTTQYGSSYVDYQAMRKLDKANTYAEIEKHMDAIKLKTEEAQTAFDALFKAQAEGNLAELNNQKAIIDTRKKEIEQINLMVDALEGSLSALNAFKQASSMGELGDNFRATKDALDAINDGLESGRVGTNKFASAVELMFGENVLNSFRSGKTSRADLQKMMKSVGGFYDEDGNINRDAAFKRFIDADIASSFTNKSGEKRFAFDADTTMADIQEALGGVSEEMATYFLDAINEYAQGEHERIGPADYLASYEERMEALQKVDSMAVQAGNVTISTDKIKNDSAGGDNTSSSGDLEDEARKERLRLIKEQAEIDVRQARDEQLDREEHTRRRADLEAQKAIAEAERIRAEEEATAQLTENAAKLAVMGGDLSPEAYNYVEAQKDLYKTYQEEIEAHEKIAEDIQNLGADQFGISTKNSMQRAVADVKIAQMQAQMPIDADTAPAEESNDELVAEIETGATKPVDLDTSTAEAQSTALHNEASAPVTIPVVFGTPSNYPSPYAQTRSEPTVSYAAQVDGGIAYANGNTLVGELAPEIIVDRKTGTWSLAEYPQLRKLNAGDIVFNGEQTKAILNGWKTGFSKTVGGKSNVDGGIKSGKAYAVGLNGYKSRMVEDDHYIASSIIEALKKKYSTNSQPMGDTGKPKGSGGDSSGGSDEAEQEEKEWYDWIVKALELAKKATEKAIEDIVDKIGYIAKNAQIDRALEKNQSELTKNQAAYDRYMQHADLIARRNGLSSSMVNDIQNGKIDITEYDEETVGKIQEYQEWHEKAESVLETIEELKKQEIELQRQKLDNIDEYYDKKIDRLEARISKSSARLDKKAAYGEEIVAQDYTEAIATTQEKLAELQAERKAYQEQFDQLVAAGVLEPDSDAWHEYIGALEEMDEAIVESQIDMVDLIDAMNDIPLTNLQYALERLNTLQNRLEAFQSFHAAQGVDNVASTYVDLIQNGFAQLDNLKAQNEILLKQQDGLDVNSEKWQEIQQQIEGNESTMWSLMSAQEQWNDAIADLQIDRLREERDELEKTNEVLERRKEMEDALEELEKAKSQRNKLIYKQGK